jgi:hypothetical protein
VHQHVHEHLDDMLFISNLNVVKVKDSNLEIELEVECKPEFKLCFVQANSFLRKRIYSIKLDAEYIGAFHERKDKPEFYDDEKVECSLVEKEEESKREKLEERFYIEIEEDVLVVKSKAVVN